MQTTNNIDKINIFKYLNFEKMKKKGRNPPNKIIIYLNIIAIQINKYLYAIVFLFSF